MSILYGRLSFPIHHTGVCSDGSWIYRRYADSPRLEAQHEEVDLGTYATALALGAVGGFSARSLLDAAGGGEVDPAAGGAAAHQRDRHHGESGGEEIGSFRRQGSVSGLGRPAGKVQDAGNS
jgi:hypothetical protein